MNHNDICKGTLQREMTLDRKSIDTEKRVVHASLSSETPVKRWFGTEKLVHEKAAVNLERAADGLPLLFGHDQTQPIGLARNVRLDGEKLRAELHFSNNTRASEVWQDVNDGFLRNISIGYQVNKFEETDNSDEVRITQWSVLEASVVSVPADNFVGINRGASMIMQRGNNLSAALNNAIESMEDDETPRSSIIESMASAAGIDTGTVNQILNGDINCPPLERLSGFSESLNVSQDSLISAAGRDGCNYENETDRSKSIMSSKNDDGNLNVVAFESARRSGRIEGEAEAQRKMTDNIKQIDDLFAMPAYRSQAYQDLKMELIRTGKTFEQARDALLEMVGGNSAPLAGEHRQDTQAPAQRGAAGMQRTHIQAGEDTNDKFSDIVEKALLVRVGAVHDKDVMTEVRQSEYGDMLVSEMARDFLTRNHISTSGLKREQLIGKAMTRAIIGHGTSDFANVLENVANKSMLLGYEESPETWPMIARSISVPDFKSNSFVGLSEFGSLPEVKANGEYTYGTMSDRKESAQLATFGQLFSISRQALANDDLDSLGRAPRSMGRAASRTIGDKVYEILTSNPTLNQDATSLFDAAGHGNDIAAGSGAAPSVATLDVARVAMATQKDQASATTSLNIRLARLIVPVALETTSNILQAAENDPATGGSATGPNPNPFRGTFQVVADARLDDADPAEWFASADPNVTDTIGACFLNGQTTPFLEQQEKLEVDGLVYKVRIDCVALALDFRGLFRNDGN